MSPKPFAEQCEILQGNIPRANLWTGKSVWDLTKGTVRLAVECEGNIVKSVDWRPAERFIGYRFVRLLQWLGERPGRFIVNKVAASPNS